MKKKLLFGALISGVVFSLGLTIYIYSIYSDLIYNFEKPAEFVPTRIYSDVTQVRPGAEKVKVISRLKTLGYTFESDKNVIQFVLKNTNYPPELTSPDFSRLALKDAKIRLEFEGETAFGPLLKIFLNEQEIPTLYLEPEAIALLTKNGSQKATSIRQVLVFSEIPAPIWKAIIAVEDQHFLEHNGLDPRGFARAIWINLKTLSFAQGGSTVTQQLVKNLMERKNKNILKKFTEIFLSLLVEIKFDKEKILERYLNEVYLGQMGSIEIHGVSEGAKHFFGKRIEELNLAESALMAGLIRGPAFYSPSKHKDRALKRMKLVLEKMVETGQIAPEELQAALQSPLKFIPTSGEMNRAPYFVDYVKAELKKHLKTKMTDEEMSQAGFKIYTTLDPVFYQIAQQSVWTGIEKLYKKHKLSKSLRLEGALATVENETGFVRTLIGGKNYENSTFNRILNMKRQAGSTFKPIVALAAIEKGFDSKDISFGGGYPLLDAPLKVIYDNGNQEWSPKNYEKEFAGWVSLRTVLAHSINTATARLGIEVGLPNIVEVAHRLGIESEIQPLPAMVLGSEEVAPVELLRAYYTIAQNGFRDDLMVIRSITQEDDTPYAHSELKPTQRGAPEDYSLLTNLLQSTFSEGTAKSAQKLGWTRPAAGKTGTTSQSRDSWFVGYTPQLTTVVWVGLDTVTEKEQTKIHLTGAEAALPIWIDSMLKFHEGMAIQDFKMHENIRSIKVDRQGFETSFLCANGLDEKYTEKAKPKKSGCNLFPPKEVKEIRQ